MSHPALTPPPPRRTDDAFARAVASDVGTVRQSRLPSRFVFAVPATAGVAMAIAVAFGGGTVDPTSGNPGAVASVTDSVADSDSLTALVVAEVDAVDEEFALDDVDDATLLAFADLDPAPAFAFADLDGSTDQDLDAVEAALDRAIRNL